MLPSLIPSAASMISGDSPISPSIAAPMRRRSWRVHPDVPLASCRAFVAGKTSSSAALGPRLCNSAMACRDSSTVGGSAFLVRSTNGPCLRGRIDFPLTRAAASSRRASVSSGIGGIAQPHDVSLACRDRLGSKRPLPLSAYPNMGISEADPDRRFRWFHRMAGCTLRMHMSIGTAQDRNISPATM
jgi:hypothetical protein